MTAISRRRVSSKDKTSSPLVDGTADHTPNRAPRTTLAVSAMVALTFMAAGCGGGSGKSTADAESFLSADLDATAGLVGATVVDVRCDAADIDEWTCKAFNSLSGEQTYTVRYADGQWSFTNDGN